MGVSRRGRRDKRASVADSALQRGMDSKHAQALLPVHASTAAGIRMKAARRMAPYGRRPVACLMGARVRLPGTNLVASDIRGAFYKPATSLYESNRCYTPTSEP